MKHSIATVSLSGTLEQKIAAIAAAKFDGLEIFESDMLSFKGSARDLNRMIKDSGLKTLAFQPFRDFEGMPEPFRTQNFSRAEHKFDLIQELECDLLLICSNVSPHAQSGMERLAADFYELGERAKKRGIRVAYEALSWGLHINDYRDSWEVVRRANHDNVGLLLDSFHILVKDTDLNPISVIPKEKIFFVQVADAPKLKYDYLSIARHHRCFPYQGDLDMKTFMEKLTETGYNDVLSHEIFSDRFRAGLAKDVALDAKRSLIALEDDGEVKRGKQYPVTMPPRSIVQSIEFIEFALDDKSATEFKALISALGFVKTGQHKSKNVEQWQQGKINLVLNLEQQGFAHSFNIVHGTSVCAICLKVNDAKKTLERAVALLDKPFFQSVGAGELDIPSVRSVGGSLIYFIDEKHSLNKLWDTDFIKTGTPAGIGLVQTDHIAQSMLHEELLTWLLFYNTLLNVEKLPLVSVNDPQGVVQSQVLTAKDNTLRLILNASQSAKTHSSRFLTQGFGSGVQHIAFETKNIFKTSEALQKNNVKTLEIPQNYYRDLQSRTALTSDELLKMQAGNILYDNDEKGDFFQIYTQNLDNGFFFEVVERRGYIGLGAGNASVRLTSQTELAQQKTSL